MKNWAHGWNIDTATPRELAAAGHYRADMTLGEAMQVLTGPLWACACVGPPWPSPRWTPCHCRLTTLQAQMLQRGAHIVVKLLAEGSGGEGRGESSTVDASWGNAGANPCSWRLVESRHGAREDTSRAGRARDTA